MKRKQGVKMVCLKIVQGILDIGEAMLQAVQRISVWKTAFTVCAKLWI